MRVAALADVHGNAPALEAVLAEVEAAAPDLIVFGGDLTWGPLPEETLALVERLRDRALFVQGNAEETLLRVAAGEPAPSERAAWIVDRHDAEARAFVATFVESAVVEVDGLGPTRFCHGSPRSVIELVTERTPVERVRELLAGVAEQVVVTAHAHVQYDRRVDGVRLTSPGSVGLPYEGRRGAYWALLGPDVDLRRTEYDVADAVSRLEQGGLPGVDEREGALLLTPPTRDEAIDHAESVAFSD